MNLTSFLQALKAHEVAVAAAEDNYVPRLEMGKFLRFAGFRKSAACHFKAAEKMGAPFKQVGVQIATLEYQLHYARSAAAYLQDHYETDRSTQKYYRHHHQHYRALADASDAAQEQVESGALTPETALLVLDKHLAAREFGRLISTVKAYGLSDERFRRGVTLNRLAELETIRSEGREDWASAVELALLYDAERRPADGAAILADYDVAAVESEDALERIVQTLSRLGNDLAAALFTRIFLRSRASSPKLRRLLMGFAQALNDPHCLLEVSTLEAVTEELTQAQRSFATYARLAASEISPRALELVLTTTKEMLVAASGLATIEPGQASRLRAAAYMTAPKDESSLIGLDSRYLDVIRGLQESRPFPSNAGVAALSGIAIKSDVASLAQAGFPFPAADLAMICAPVERLDGDVPAGRPDVLAPILRSRKEFSPKTPKRLIGQPGDGWSHADFSNSFTTWDVHLAHMQGASLIGRGLLVDRKGQAVVDVQNDGIRRNFLTSNLRNVQPAWMKKASLKLGADEKSFKYASILSNEVKIVENDAYLLDNGQGYNFANWHMYIFPRLFGYFQGGLDRSKTKLVVYKGTSTRLLEMLKGFGFEDDDLYVHDPLQTSIFNNLYVPTAMSDVEKLWVPDAFRVYDRLSVDGLRRSGYRADARWTDETCPRKVYLSRSDVHRRRLLNETKIEDLARNCGYEVVLPAGLSLVDVVQLYRNVDVICGPSGSSFLNMLLMKRGSRAVMISHPLYSPTAYLCCQFGSLRDIEVDVVFGRVEGGEPILGHQEAFSVSEADVLSLIG